MVNAWLAICDSIATAKETYAGHEIYTIPVGEAQQATRPLRIAQLGYDTIAASNMPTAEQIHSMLDRYRAAASPFSGSSLLSARYRDVPASRAPGRSATSGCRSRTAATSASSACSCRCRRTPPLSPACAISARSICASSRSLRPRPMLPMRPRRLTTLLGLVKSVQQTQAQMHPTATSDAPFVELINSAKIEQHKDRAVLTANIPLDLVKRLTTPSPEGKTMTEPASPAVTRDHSRSPRSRASPTPAAKPQTTSAIP